MKPSKSPVIRSGVLVGFATQAQSKLRSETVKEVVPLGRLLSMIPSMESLGRHPAGAQENPTPVENYQRLTNFHVPAHMLFTNPRDGA